MFLFCIDVLWDKTTASNGMSNLHLDNSIKHLADCLGRIKKKFFSSRMLNFDVFDSKYSFFVNSVGNKYSWINMTNVSENMGLEVTSYSFRRVNSTWGTSHDDAEIRRLEEVALQHSSKVAHESYKMNKTLDTQKYVQKYMADEKFYSKELKGLVDIDRKAKKNIAKKNAAENHQKRYLELKTSKEKADNHLKKYRPLGPKCRISGDVKEKFRQLFMMVSGLDLLELALKLKVKEWRLKVVKLVCMTEGQCCQIDFG